MSAIVLYRIPRGYTSEINRVRDAMPDASEEDVVIQWCTDKFGIWITDNITQNYVFANASASSFDIVFDDAADARRFVQEVGGVVR